MPHFSSASLFDSNISHHTFYFQFVNKILNFKKKFKLLEFIPNKGNIYIIKLFLIYNYGL